MARLRHEQVEQPLLDAFFGRPFDFLTEILADNSRADFGEVANHALDVAAVIADLGVLGGFDFEKRRADQLGQPPGDLSLTDARRSDHDDVLGRDVFAQFR